MPTPIQYTLFFCLVVLVVSQGPRQWVYVRNQNSLYKLYHSSVDVHSGLVIWPGAYPRDIDHGTVCEFEFYVPTDWIDPPTNTSMTITWYTKNVLRQQKERIYIDILLDTRGWINEFGCSITDQHGKSHPCEHWTVDDYHRYVFIDTGHLEMK
ncbi:hypothetical protein P9112_000168 [Eukaryota sp. TZLM1-RC]